MTKTTEAQLSLIELPPAPQGRRAARRRLSPELTVQHCQALLAAIDRSVELATRRASEPRAAQGDLRAARVDRQAEHALRLYEAVERAISSSGEAAAAADAAAARRVGGA